jgi:small GTP-binding protein
MELIELCGAEIVTSERMLFALAASQNKNAVFAEAQVAGAKAKTLAGNKIIANQVTSGLTQIANGWLENLDPERINHEAKKILADSEIARLVIYGCKTIIVGPANSGKSTLLNALTGREKAIVTDIKGTTRDWVSGSFQTGEFFVELIDTAGLGQFADDIDKTSQEKTFEILKSANVVLLLLDNSTLEPFELPEILLDKKIIVALNKSDLAQRFTADTLPGGLAQPVKISAKTGDNLDELKNRIRRICGSENFDLSKPICFTERQEKIMRKLAGADSENEVCFLTTELLNARNCV